MDLWPVHTVSWNMLQHPPPPTTLLNWIGSALKKPCLSQDFSQDFSLRAKKPKKKKSQSDEIKF